ncbi:MAG: glycoside hydrolase family 2 protein [Cyclobacteriaceae bacterium]|nr:glycoside hydrolase family 2 protein [Cyclobacteriaceae bacterium]
MYNPLNLILCFGLLCGTMIACKQKEPVSGIQVLKIDNWRFRQADTISEWMYASVPGTVHTDLYRNGKVDDPFYRTNERDQQWIDKVDWEYQGTFEVSPGFLDNDQIEVNFEGLDTYADVFINDQKVLSTENMFVRYKADIKPYITLGTNKVRVYFHSPIQKGLEKLEAHGFGLPASNDQSENGGLEDKRVSVFSRKAGYHYGWDWGPRFVTSGIWKPMSIRGWKNALLRDVFIRQMDLSDELAKLRAVSEVEAFEATEAVYGVYHEDKLLAETGVKLQTGLNILKLDFNIEKPKRWWSNGLGEPHLYELEVKLLVDKTYQESVTQNVGLRTLRLIQEPDEKGKTFYFELNGVPVFAKGANYIPNDNFLPRVSNREYETVVMSAKNANMNMLRIWGGGIYENKIFYDLCDKNGIMVWQDFMFACSMYPGDQAFLNNVRLEAVDNVKRLRQHPSIVLWCGNNEIDGAWSNYDEKAGWGWKQQYTAEQRKYIWQAYEDVFHEILPEVVQEWDPDRYYWPSSPMAGLTGGPDQHANDFTRGDIHYWGVWHGLEPFENFKTNVGRFMSEYGFQSFPEYNTVRRYSEPEDWDIESEVMAAHQRSGIGNLRIKEYMSWDYRIPKNFEHFLYVGQLLQAEGMKAAFEAHRSAMPYCMGSLYWQLNDCWPVASWSSTDYYRNWKAMHYFARDAFKEVATSIHETEEEIEVIVASDRLSSFTGEIRVQVLDFEGNMLYNESQRAYGGANTASRIFQKKKADLFKGANLNQTVVVARLTENGNLLSESIWYPVKPKALQLPKARLEKSMTQGKDYIEIVLKTDKLIKNLYLSITDRSPYFSDNYFDMLPGSTKTIQVKTEIPLKDFRDGLKIISLEDTY